MKIIYLLLTLLIIALTVHQFQARNNPDKEQSNPDSDLDLNLDIQSNLQDEDGGPKKNPTRSSHKKRPKRTEIAFALDGYPYCKALGEFMLKMKDIKLIRHPTFTRKPIDRQYQHLYACNFPNFDVIRPDKLTVNHNKNISQIYSKATFIKNLKKYDREQTDFPFNSSVVFPESYIIQNGKNKESEDEYKEFLNNLNERKYWITKDPLKKRQSLGISIFEKPSDIVPMIDSYKSAKISEDTKKKELVVQKYLENNLLLNGKKVGSRDFVTIISFDPFVVLYHKGYIKRCILNYDLDRLDSSKPDLMGHLDNFYIWDKKSVYPEINRKFWQTEFQRIMKTEYGFSDSDVDQYYDNAKAILLYSVLSVKDSFHKHIGSHLLLGYDVAIDDKFNQYILEFNLYPLLKFPELKLEKNVPNLYEDYDRQQLENKQKDKWEYWKNPNTEVFGDWEIIYNEATQYNFLDEKLKSSCNDPSEISKRKVKPVWEK